MVGIEPTSAAQARENLRRGAEEDVKRLGNTSNNQMHASSSSARQGLGQHNVAKDQPREGASSVPKEELTPEKGKSMDDAREGAPAAAHDNTNASHASSANFTSPGLTVPPKLANLATAVFNNTGVLVSLEIILDKIDKIKRVVDATVNAVDSLAKASSLAEHVEEINLNYRFLVSSIRQCGMDSAELGLQGTLPGDNSRRHFLIS